MPIHILQKQAYHNAASVMDNHIDASHKNQLLPAGHVTVGNVLFVPLFANGEAIGLIGLANAPTGFTTNQVTICEHFSRLTETFLEFCHSRQRHSESDNIWRQLFEENKAIKLIIEEDSGRILHANEAAAEFYGYSTKTLSSMKIMDINTLPKKEIAAEMARAKLRQKAHFDFTHRLANGELRNVEVCSSPLQFRGKRVLYSIIHDTTDRVEAKRQVEQQQSELLRQFRIAEEKNIAIEQIAERLRQQRQNQSKDLATNIETILVPLLDRLRLNSGNALTSRQLDILENTVRSLGTSYGAELNKLSPSLTPREKELCTLIRGGLSSKEIGKMLNISPRSVENQRHRIRKKFRLKRDVNLVNYLQSIAKEL